MLKTIYKSSLLMVAALMVSCSSDDISGNIEPGETPIALTGMLSRSGGTTGYLSGYTNLKLTAKVIPTGGTEQNYFVNKDVSVDAEINGNEYKLISSVYYPLSDNSLKLFSHTGDIDASGNLSLTSGKVDATNDILISNGTDGTGTSGSSSNAATLLTYRHVMTKLEVEIKVDGGVEETQPTDIKFEVGTNIPTTGKYSLTTSTTDDTNNKAVSTSGTYTLTTGTHYLVPNGTDLTDMSLTKLEINDYKATSEDLTALTLPKAVLNDTESDLVLKPGLAYKLIFNIKNLKVTSIELKMIDWTIKTGDGSWGYDPYKVTMNVSDGYTNSGDKLINKVVLKYQPASGGEKYQYIGGTTTVGNDAIISFVTLPNIAVSTSMTADLYTKNGLLIEDHAVTYDPTNKQLSMNLSANGMVKDVDGYYEITTPLQFYNFMNAPQKDTQYKLTDNMDMDGLPAQPTPMTEFPTGAVLDGNGKTIVHLNLSGNGLITTNNGTLTNVHISTGTITTAADFPAGGICSVNKGTIEACINEADLTGKATTLGGVCGKNTGTIIASVNTGNINIGTTVGGICGENENSVANAFLACVNTGSLNKLATYLGGVIGNSSVTIGNKLVSNCFWLTGTARRAQGTSDEVAIGNGVPTDKKQTDYCTNSADLAPERLRSSEAIIGGITMLNEALSTNLCNWKYQWTETANGTYDCVWPLPVKK